MANVIAVVMFAAFGMLALSVTMRDLSMALLWWGGFNAAFLAWAIARGRRKWS